MVASIHSEPADGHQFRSKEAQCEEGRVGMDGKKIIHESKLSETGCDVKVFGEGDIEISEVKKDKSRGA